MKKQLLFLLLGFSITSLYAVRHNQQKTVPPYKITVTNNTGKNIVVEFHADQKEYKRAKKIMFNSQTKPKDVQRIVSINYCVKKITVKEKKPRKDEIVLEKQVNICEDTHFDINLSKDGTFSIMADFFGGWGWSSY